MKIVVRVRRASTLLLAWLLFVTISYSQTADLFSLSKEAKRHYEKTNVSRDALLQTMQVHPEVLQELVKGSVSNPQLLVPFMSESLTLDLYRYFEYSTEVFTWDGKESVKVNVKPTLLYEGHIQGMERSMVSMYTLDGTIRGGIYLPGKGSFDFGPDPSDYSDLKYILISKAKSREGRPLECSAIDDLYYRDRTAIESRIVRTTCKKVQFSVHADYDLYLKLGANVQNVVDYVKGVFHGSSQIYRKEGVHVELREIVVHTAEDNLPHTSASDDLWAFKQVFKTYNGNLVILLSGYTDSQGNSPLGGTAFTNSLCIRRYSYAYGNVEINLKSYPKYSWDVHVFTHEIGHILGSPHTHDCVWGPNHDTPIDGCYPPSGACVPGPIPDKGTIMSYCHLPGKPGVDFTLGFGKEPGDKIRAKIESSSCLGDYIPGANLPVAKGIYIANVECSDGDVVHYYYDNNTVDEADDIWVLTIDTRGEDIGHIGEPGFEVKVEVTENSYKPTAITADYVPAGQVFYVINRYWSVHPIVQPQRPLLVQFPFTQADFEGLNQILNGVDLKEVESYKISSPGDPNPAHQHKGTTSSSYTQYKYGNWPSLTTWNQTYSTYGYRVAEFEVNHFSGGGLGVYTQGALAVRLNDFSAYEKEGKVYLKWSTGFESNTASYVIEKSSNGADFDVIGRVKAKGDAQGTSKYLFIDDLPGVGTNSYRLKILDIDNTFDYSPIVEVRLERNNQSEALPLFVVNPNPVIHRFFSIKVDNRGVFPAQLQMFNAIGQAVFTRSIHSNNVIIDTEGMSSGIYWLRLVSGGDSYVKTVVIY